MSYTDIAKIIPTMQSVALVNENLKDMKKKKGTGKMTEMGVKNIVGINLMKETADLI